MMGGEFWSTVSRYLSSERSSMRAPLSEIEPERLGVSMRTRGEAASAASRVVASPAETIVPSRETRLNNVIVARSSRLDISDHSRHERGRVLGGGELF